MEDYQTLLIAAVTTIVMIVVVGIVVAVVRRRLRARADEAPLPLIPFSPGRTGPIPARPEQDVTPMPNARSSFANAPAPAWTSSVEHTPPSPRPRSPYAPPPHGTVVTPGATGAAGPLADTARPNELVEGAPVDGASMRYWRPADGTLQFLPGRLEVIAGRDAGQEIRFVRTPGPDGSRVTFGRAEGAPYRHVQLREPTVSRTHARMTLETNGTHPGVAGAPASGPRWRLENLSATNPVVVNGRPLAADGTDAGSVRLDEGDRIEMGEVVFRFHEK